MNPLTKHLRMAMLEENKLDIPYDSVGFEKWLVESANMSVMEAHRQVERIRESDIELWQPGDPEIFAMIGEWCKQAEDTGCKISELLYGFAIDAMKAYIESIEELGNADKKLNERLKANKWYLRFLESTMTRNLINRFPDAGIYETEPVFENHYPVPLEDEYKEYLNIYPARTKSKMLCNLRNLNDLVLKRSRGEEDIDWLDSLAKRSESGFSIGLIRLMAYKICHGLISNAKDYNMSVLTARACQTALNSYIDFLAKRASEIKSKETNGKTRSKRTVK